MPQILLIEDDSATARSIEGMLRALGHDVVWASNGLDGLRLSREMAPVAAVLTDILMPQMDGLESIRQLRSLWPTVPLIAMTGHQDGSYLKAAEVYGAAVTLDKPFTLDQLQAALDRAFLP